MAALMWKDGIKAVVPIWRGDIWGDGLSKATKTRFESLGGTVLEGIRYDPDTDFSAEEDILSSKVSQAVDRFGRERVAVHFIGFNEVVNLFTRTQNQSSYSNTGDLSKVVWQRRHGSG
jgi:branched-chain amino acid transport system substrate-binding protein